MRRPTDNDNNREAQGESDGGYITEERTTEISSPHALIDHNDPVSVFVSFPSVLSLCGQLCRNHCESLYSPRTARHAVVWLFG